MGNKKNQKKTAPKNAAGAKTRAKSNKTNSKPASDDEETEAKKMERACNTRNHQVRSLANEMDIKPVSRTYHYVLTHPLSAFFLMSMYVFFYFTAFASNLKSSSLDYA